MKKLVIYDDVIFRLQKVGGISAVFYHLILNSQNDDDFEVKYISTTKFKIDNFYWKQLIKPRIFLQKIKPKVLVQLLPFYKLFSAEFSIFHSTYYNFPIFKPRKMRYVITIHDLGYERGVMRSGLKRITNILFKKCAIKKADGIICVSKSTFDDLFKYYGKYLNDKKVKVIHNGITENFMNQSLPGSSLGSKNILFVGGRQGYKNFNKVIEAVSLLKNYQLTILGGGPISNHHLFLLESSIPKRYSIYSDLSEDELIHFYRSAYCLIYPSSFEGFGLPLIEAMASGCPVIACSNSSILEIAGEYAVLIPEPEPNNILRALKLLKNEDYRSKLIDRAFKYSKSFSCAITWEKTKEFYVEMLANQ